MEPTRDLWPLVPGFPGPAAEAVLAALPTPAKRSLRLTCAAGRTAVDGRIRRLLVDCYHAALPAAAPRLLQLEHLELKRMDADGARAAAAGLRALPPGALTSLQMYLDGDNLPPQALLRIARAVAARGGLRALSLDLARLPEGVAREFLELPARLRLASFEVGGWSKWRGGRPPAVRLPWAQLEEVALHGGGPQLLQQLLQQPALPRLRRLHAWTNSLPAGPAAVWAAPWLSQLTSLELHIDMAAPPPPPPAGLALPALRELELWGGGGGADAAACFASWRLPALTRLKLYSIKPGGLAPLLAAAWAPGLAHLHLLDTKGDDGWGAPHAFAPLAAAPLAALTSLTLAPRSAVAVASHMALLSARWLPRVRELRLLFQPPSPAAGGVMLHALAAAELPAITRLDVGDWALTHQLLADYLPLAPWANRIAHLSLAFNELGAPGLAALADIDFPSLQTLDISCTGTGSPGALRRLAAARWLPALRKLVLGGTCDPDVRLGAMLAEALSPAGPLAPMLARGGDVDTVYLCDLLDALQYVDDGDSSEELPDEFDSDEFGG